MFGINLLLAIVGISLEAVFKSRVKKISMIIYIVMGWLIIVAWKPMLGSMDSAFVKWLLGGGIFYTAGIVFYIIAGKKFFHVYWHFMVVAGTVMHFFGMLFYIAV